MVWCSLMPSLYKSYLNGFVMRGSSDESVAKS